MEFSQYLASAPPDEFFWWSAIPGALVVAGFIATFVYLRRTRLIEDMPTSRLRSAAQGYVEIEGIASLMEGPPIICPLTATRCVWWRYKVEKKETDVDNQGKSRTSWVTVDSGVSDDCFLLDDGTGQCVVDPTGAQVIPTVTRRWYGHHARPDIGFEHGRGFWRSAFCDYRYTEELIMPANAVYALGGFRTQGGGPDPVDEQADLRELLAKWKGDRSMMALLDRNKDGTVDMKEWEAARRMALGKVREQHVRRAVETPDLHILAKPRDRRPYVLSGVPQAALVRRFRGYALACLAGMTGAGAFFLFAMRARGLL